MNGILTTRTADPAHLDGPLTPCERLGPALWFSALPADLDLAKAFCRNCTVRTPCLADALERREPHGVWGGEIFDRGVVVPRKRPRGRPPKRKAFVRR